MVRLHLHVLLNPSAAYLVLIIFLSKIILLVKHSKVYHITDF